VRKKVNVKPCTYT